jgi:hypothetical protein
MDSFFGFDYLDQASASVDRCQTLGVAVELCAMEAAARSDTRTRSLAWRALWI